MQTVSVPVGTFSNTFPEFVDLGDFASYEILGHREQGPIVKASGRNPTFRADVIDVDRLAPLLGMLLPFFLVNEFWMVYPHVPRQNVALFQHVAAAHVQNLHE